jgi:flagellar biosynthesis protein
MFHHYGCMTDTPAERRHDMTHIALAVEGRDGRQAVLTARGKGAVAAQILDLAFAHDVKVREDKALVQMLASYDIDSPIPLPALDAVCQLLCHVYDVTRGPRPEGF